MLKPLTVWIRTNWKILKEVGIPDHLTFLLRNPYAGQEATEQDMEQQTGSKLGKRVCQGCMLPSCLFNLYAEYIMWHARLDESQAGIKTGGRNINNVRYVDDTTQMAESKEEIKSLLMGGAESKLKSWLKTQHSKNEDHGIWPYDFMANRWGNNGNSDRLSFLGLQNHCRWLLQVWN